MRAKCICVADSQRAAQPSWHFGVRPLWCPAAACGGAEGVPRKFNTRLSGVPAVSVRLGTVILEPDIVHSLPVYSHTPPALRPTASYVRRLCGGGAPSGPLLFAADGCNIKGR